MPSWAISRQRVGQERMPIAIAPIDRQRRAVRLEFGAQRGDQGPILRVQGLTPPKCS